MIKSYKNSCLLSFKKTVLLNSVFCWLTAFLAVRLSACGLQTRRAVVHEPGASQQEVIHVQFERVHVELFDGAEVGEQGDCLQEVHVSQEGGGVGQERVEAAVEAGVVEAGRTQVAEEGHQAGQCEEMSAEVGEDSRCVVGGDE